MFQEMLLGPFSRRRSGLVHQKGTIASVEDQSHEQTHWKTHSHLYIFTSLQFEPYFSYCMRSEFETFGGKKKLSEVTVSDRSTISKFPKRDVCTEKESFLQSRSSVVSPFGSTTTRRRVSKTERERESI